MNNFKERAAQIITKNKYPSQLDKSVASNMESEYDIRRKQENERLDALGIIQMFEQISVSFKEQNIKADIYYNPNGYPNPRWNFSHEYHFIPQLTNIKDMLGDQWVRYSKISWPYEGNDIHEHGGTSRIHTTAYIMSFVYENDDVVVVGATSTLLLAQERKDTNLIANTILEKLENPRTERMDFEYKEKIRRAQQSSPSYDYRDGR